MSHELFGIATGARDRARPRTGSIVGASALAHGGVCAGIVLMQVLAPGRLPMPTERALAYVETQPILRVADLPLPPERPRPARDAAAEPNRLQPAEAVQAPIDAPPGITPENSGAPTGTSTPGFVARSGIENGGTGPIEVVGVPTAPPAPSPQLPMRLHSGIRAPATLVHVPPVYPEIARASHVQGVVIIEATIDPQGNVQSARVLKSVALLDQAALEAVRQWKYTPTLLNGVAVPIIMTVTVNFTLER